MQLARFLQFLKIFLFSSNYQKIETANKKGLLKFVFTQLIPVQTKQNKTNNLT